MKPCDVCEERMLLKSFPTCKYCAQDLVGCENPCPSCRDDLPQIDGMLSLGMWNGPLREWLAQLKYGGDVRMAEWLGIRLAELWRVHWDGIPIVPVPPRPIKLFKKGKDTVESIVNEMKKNNVPIMKILRRQGNKTQKSLNKEDRIRGSSLKYIVKGHLKISEQSYVLLDDITTTGATLNYCAGVLKNAGATQIYGLVVCKD